MITNLHKGSFEAFRPHDWDEEKALYEEMQEIANWTAGLITVEDFNLVVKARVNQLNKSYINFKKRFEVFFNDAGAVICYQKLEACPLRENTFLYVPTTISEYSILRQKKQRY